MKMASYTIKHFCLKQNFSCRILEAKIPWRIRNSLRSYSSALFIPGNKAHKTFAYLSPKLDFDERFKDIKKLQNELTLRGLKINAEELQKTWNYYQYVNSNRHVLEEKHYQISNNIKIINQNENLSSDDKTKKNALITQSRLVKQDLKTVKEAAWEMEESVVPQMLKLPIEVDGQTPIEGPILLKSVGEKPKVSDSEKQNHLDIGKKLGLIDYRNPLHCFLCNEAAIFELNVISLAGRILKENDILRIAAPDFSRSIVVEGSGLDHESAMETFILQNGDHVEKDYLVNRLHLVGGASLPALLALYTKTRLSTKQLPNRIFASGRQYTPFPNTLVAHGLFSVCQASVVQTLTLIEKKHSEEYHNEFQKSIDLTSKIYDEIGCHYRIIMKSIKELNVSESKRVSFEMWSAHSNQYIEVGHVSAHSDYFSKRLLIADQTVSKSNFPATVTGIVLSVPRVLGCLLEENPEKFTLPEKLNEVTY